MSNLEIKYEILNYNKYKKRIDDILNNINNKFKVVKHESLGKSSCGFEIEHYSIGNGPMHITFLAGAHGNEIIGVDYITQLMNNVALGNGEFENFDPNLYTIDFIPCQNPEGYFTTTYALDSVLKDMNDLDIEKFSKEYWARYRSDDIIVSTFNGILKTFCTENNLEEIYSKLNSLFWNMYRDKNITKIDLINFFSEYTNIEENIIIEYVEKNWKEKFKDKKEVENKKEHLEIFGNLSLDCIPELDESHKKLKEKLTNMYKNNTFPINTLANFFANSDGVNLNDNNEEFFNEFKENIKKSGTLYGNLRDNNIIKSIPGPIGMPSKSLDKFEYAPENIALFNFLEKQKDNQSNFAFINCHGTGGLLYLYPVEEIDMDKVKKEGATRDFKFYINNRISTEYTNSIGKVYEEKTGKFAPYKTMGYPQKITGVGDMLRKKYIASFLLELSKMGGNPIAPYGDKNGNYTITMESNMISTKKLLDTIKNLSHLYDTSYEMSYDESGKVHYRVI